MKECRSTQLLVFCLLVILLSSCHAKKTERKAYYNAETFVPPYKLIVPENWTSETFGIPIEFAPSIPYVGIEEVRFAPGWDYSSSEDYWTYSYLWYLDGDVSFDVETIEQNLEAYYTGLINRNIQRRRIPKEKLFQVNATFEKVDANQGDESTFRGSVNMLDYMAQEPILLNFMVHVKKCPGADNTFVFYKVSPHNQDHAVWNTLNQIWTEFECNK
jgi:hypothetical protein